MSKNDLHSEKSLLGSIIFEPECIDLVRQYVPEGRYFYNQVYAQAYDTAIRLKDEGREVDITTVVDNMDSDNGTIPKIMEAVDSVPTAAHAEEYAQAVRDNYLRRLLGQALKAINPLDKSRYPSVLDALNETERQFEGLANMIKRGEETDIKDLLTSSYEKYMEEAERRENPNIIPTGFYDLDGVTSGIEKGETVIIAARPSMGKTALALCMALNIAKKGREVIFFSLEMTKERLVNRLICIEGRLNATNFKKRSLSSEEVSRMIQAINVIAGLPIKIIDNIRTTTEIKSIVARQSLKNEVGAVFVDFLTLLNDKRSGGMSQADYVGSLVKGLQDVGKKYRVPIIILSQLSRALSQRNDKRPVMTDLRESGNIEEAADMILFLHRDDYYQQDSENKGIAEVGIAKARDGETGNFELRWMPQSTRFDNLLKECAK